MNKEARIFILGVILILVSVLMIEYNFTHGYWFPVLGNMMGLVLGFYAVLKPNND